MSLHNPTSPTLLGSCTAGTWTADIVYMRSYWIRLGPKSKTALLSVPRRERRFGYRDSKDGVVREAATNS